MARAEFEDNWGIVASGTVLAAVGLGLWWLFRPAGVTKPKPLPPAYPPITAPPPDEGKGGEPFPLPAPPPDEGKGGEPFPLPAPPPGEVLQLPAPAPLELPAPVYTVEPLPGALDEYPVYVGAPEAEPIPVWEPVGGHEEVLDIPEQIPLPGLVGPPAPGYVDPEAGSDANWGWGPALPLLPELPFPIPGIPVRPLIPAPGGLGEPVLVPGLENISPYYDSGDFWLL